MLSRLPITIRPAADEIAISYLARLATLHGMPLSELWSQVTHSVDRESPRLDVDLLVTVANQPHDRLARALIELRNPEPDWLALRHESQRGCPRCDDVRHPGGSVLLPRLVTDDGALWIADSGREMVPEFLTLTEPPWRTVEVVPTAARTSRSSAWQAHRVEPAAVENDVRDHSDHAGQTRQRAVLPPEEYRPLRRRNDRIRTAVGVAQPAHGLAIHCQRPAPPDRAPPGASALDARNRCQLHRCPWIEIGIRFADGENGMIPRNLAQCLITFCLVRAGHVGEATDRLINPETRVAIDVDDVRLASRHRDAAAVSGPEFTHDAVMRLPPPSRVRCTELGGCLVIAPLGHGVHLS
jgi:hypothetical protein